MSNRKYSHSLYASYRVFLNALASLDFKLSVSQGCFSASASSGLLDLFLSWIRSVDWDHLVYSRLSPPQPSSSWWPWWSRRETWKATIIAISIFSLRQQDQHQHHCRHHNHPHPILMTLVIIRRNVEREVEIMNVLKSQKLLQLYEAYDNGRSEMCLITE